jgi:putative ABC transport system ATP-binding protein
MIEIRELIFRYKNSGRESSSGVGPINLKIGQGDFIMLTGSNGSGKSTLMKILDGTIEAQSGEIVIEGASLKELSNKRKKALIARVFQDPAKGTVDDFSILENFRIASLRGSRFSPVHIHGKTFREFIRDHVKIANRGFEEMLDRKVSELSGGQRQILSVLMNLLHPPALLLLDEPTAALDAGVTQVLIDILIKVNSEKKTSMIMVSHDLNQAIRTGSRLITMREGMLREEFSGTEKQQLRPEVLFSLLNQQ